MAENNDVKEIKQEFEKVAEIISRIPELAEEVKKDIWLQDYIEKDFKGRKLQFFTLKMEDTLNLTENLMGDASSLLKDTDKLLVMIAKSLRKDVKEIPKTPGFLMFGLDSLLEAIDFPFLLKHSHLLMTKIETLAKEMGISSPSVSPGLANLSAGQPPTP